MLLAASSWAEEYEVKVWNGGMTAIPVKQAAPGYPAGLIRSGQEGWVRMHFVVTPAGKAIDPIIIDSSGGAGFEEEARKAVAKWQFEPPESGNEDAHNLVNIRSQIPGRRSGTTTSFRREYRRIMTEVNNEENENTRARAVELRDSGRMNTFESTALWLMLGRIEGAEGNELGKLECLRRAVGVSNPRSLRGAGKRDALNRIFRIEDTLGQYAAAMQTYASLQAVEADAPLDETVVARASEIQALIDGDDILVAQATVYNPCDCDAGTPLWYYKPARRTFSFANLSGNVETFEARCEYQRVQGPVEAGTKWTLAPEWGSCRVFVFGDDGATFEFVEHLTGTKDGAPNAVAEDDVLDRRSRGQRS